MVFPANSEAQAAGVPKIQYTSTGLGRGPVTVTMPDGEVLTGQFEVAQGGASATAFGPHGTTSSAFAMSGGGNFYAAATAPHTSIICEGNVSFGHGGGICRTTAGAIFQIQL